MKRDAQQTLTSYLPASKRPTIKAVITQGAEFQEVSHPPACTDTAFKKWSENQHNDQSMTGNVCTYWQLHKGTISVTMSQILLCSNLVSGLHD